MKKITLFTPYPPTMGGTSQNLRGALPHLHDVDVTWYYLAQKPADEAELKLYDINKAVYLGKPLVGGPILQSVKRLWAFSGKNPQKNPLIKELVDKLLATDADCYWIVAFYEASAVAEALINAGKAVHISVNDDTGALYGRSRRYFWMQRRCYDQFGRILAASKSNDYTSLPMADFYKKQFGARGVSYYPYIKELPPYQPLQDDGTFRVGFAGSLYSQKEPTVFAQTLSHFAKQINRNVEWHFWGLSPKQRSWVEKLAIPTVIHPFCPETELLKQMRRINILYSMYPFDRASRTFCKFSHSAKISSYLKLQRPIFTHTPTPSSVADFILDTNIGVVYNSNEPMGMQRALMQLHTVDIPASSYADARNRWYGEENLERLNQEILHNL